MFEFKNGSHWFRNGKCFGYTKLEASEKAKEVYMSLKDKIYPPFFKSEPWLDEDFVWDIIRPGGEEAFRKMVEKGDLKDDEGYAGYEWRITN